MDPNEFLEVITRLLSTLSQSRTKTVNGKRERNHIRSVVQAWFGQYKPVFLTFLAEETPLAPIDDEMQLLLKLAAVATPRRKLKLLCTSIRDKFRNTLLFPLSRAYWSRVPEQAPSGRDTEVVRRLEKLDQALADSYEQVAEDLADKARRTFRGTAAELREVLRGVLDRLAPEDQIKDTDWYKEARRTGERKENSPTQGERTKFILRQRKKGTAAIEAAESYTKSVEERLGHVVRVAYGLASKATHAGAEHAEIVQQVRYVNALLAELLPPDENPMQVN
jgi:Predicted pPIWI-associating nuclease